MSPADWGGILYLAVCAVCAFIIVPSIAYRWGRNPPEWFDRVYRRFLSYL